MAVNLSTDFAAVTPQKKYPPIESVDNMSLTKKDLMSFIKATVFGNGLIGDSIDGFNRLVEDNGGLSRIMTSSFDIDRTVSSKLLVGDKRTFRIRISFHDVTVGKPTSTTYMTGLYSDLHPKEARLSRRPYAGPITMGATVTIDAQYEGGRTETKVAEITPFQVGRFPIMVGSVKCHTHNMPREVLTNMGEDPSGDMGMFILGEEYVIDHLEHICFNKPHIHTSMKSSEHVRVEFISQKSGAYENSSQVQIRYMTNGQLTVEINSMKFKNVRLPFFVVYRLFGMTSDRSIAETIVFDNEDRSPISILINEALRVAFKLADATFMPLVNEIDHAKVVTMTAERVAAFIANPTSGAYQANDNAVAYLNEDLLRSLDIVLLPHIGLTPEHRILKLEYLGLLIHKMFEVHFKVLPPTDRDSLRNKRVFGAGASLAKAAKTHLNNSVVTLIFKAIRREINNSTWESITPRSLADTFRNAISTADFNRAMVQTITTGKSTIIVRHLAAPNRVSSGLLERKNILNKESSLRMIVTQNAGNASKATDRADQMRRVHGSYPYFICVAGSADTGEKVGMKKHKGITARTCYAVDDFPLKNRLAEDPDIFTLGRFTSKEMLNNHLVRIFVNGEWIGVCKNPHLLVARYRALRREGRVVDMNVSISWDPISNEIEFWMDVGRLQVPLLIVDSNIDAFKQSHLSGDGSALFVQNTRFTQKHVDGILAGEIMITDLIKEGVAEYITPEEMENCLVAESIDVLRANRNNFLRQFTHVGVEQAIFGLAALMSPFGNHTQPARVTYETNQGRQSGGWYAKNFPHRADKNRFFQFTNEKPLVSTLVGEFIPAAGVNVVIAYMPLGGDNQEDSAIICKASTDFGMFEGAFFRFEIGELEKGESFGCPDALTTKNLKPNANYEKLDANGLIKVGSVVNYGDVLIGRVAKITRTRSADDSKGAASYQTVDRSIINQWHEPAYVTSVMKQRGENDELFVVVKLLYERPLRIGDKLSNRSGNKNIAAQMLSRSDMPYVSSGLPIDIIVNPTGIPTRMTMGQMIETLLGKSCAYRGAVADGTSFLPLDQRAAEDQLRGCGFRYNGRETVFNGMTGEYYDVAIFVGQMFEQRLQKFVIDDKQMVAGSGPTDATTGQPLGGKQVQGGLRCGEMEKWSLESHGSMANLFEKTHIDSDGRVMHVCRRCGEMAVYNQFRGIYNCAVCKEMADISTVETSKSAILLHEELAASNIGVRFGLNPRAFEVLPEQAQITA